MTSQYVRMFVRTRPPGSLSYEHMFPWSTPSPLARRTHDAFSLARSFLLLEDDYDVDWEVDQDEPGQGEARERGDAAFGGDDSPRARVSAGLHPHPHRMPLYRRSARKRAGQPDSPAHVCLCPVPHALRRRIDRSREGGSVALR